MIYQVYWMNKETRERFNGFVEAPGTVSAYTIVAGKLQKGHVITAVYKSSENAVTPQSLCINFRAPEYTIF